MDNLEKMDQPNQGSSSSIANKRKRGRPRRDQGETERQVNPPVTTFEENLIGRVVSGVVEGSFEAGYFLNVKVAETEKQLRGVLFLPNKVIPVTPTTDLFPQAKMYAREDIPVSSLHQQAPPQWKKDAGSQTDDIVSQPQTNKLIADIRPASDEGVVGSEAIDERNHQYPMDTEMKDVGGSSAEDKHTGPDGQTLSLMPQFASTDHAPEEDLTVLRSEACGASKTATTVTTTSPQDSYAKGSTTFVDFFPSPEMNRKLAAGSSSTLSLELFQNETQRSGTEEEGTLKDAETRGISSKPVSPVDDVPEELQLELGNKKMSVSAIATETNTDQFASSKGGFLANFFDGRGETAEKQEETNADSESGFLVETTTQVDDNDS